MLQAIGDQPVVSLNDDPLWPEADTAIKFLDKEKQHLLSRGWWFNTLSINLAPSSLDSNISLPTDTLVASFPTHNNRYRIQANKVFDSLDHTLEIQETVDSRLYLDVDYNDLPYTFSYYLSVLAIRKYQALREGQAGDNIYSGHDERSAVAQLQKEHRRNNRLKYAGNSPLSRLQRRYRQNA